MSHDRPTFMSQRKPETDLHRVPKEAQNRPTSCPKGSPEQTYIVSQTKPRADLQTVVEADTSQNRCTISSKKWPTTCHKMDIHNVEKQAYSIKRPATCHKRGLQHVNKRGLQYKEACNKSQKRPTTCHKIGLKYKETCNMSQKRPTTCHQRGLQNKEAYNMSQKRPERHRPLLRPTRTWLASLLASTIANTYNQVQ